MEMRGRCLRCGGWVWYRPAPVGVSGPCDLCGQRHVLVDGVQYVEAEVIDLTDWAVRPEPRRRARV